LHTPVLDEMAATGLRLDNFYSAHGVCSPTRGSVITGRHPNRYGSFGANWSLRPEEISIAQIAGKAGYARGQFGKWHVGPAKADSPTSPGAMGFEQWLSSDNMFEMNPMLSRNGGPPERFEGEGSAIIVEETIRFIGEAKESDRPFFAVVWFGSPHEPYSALDKDLALYKDLPDIYKGKLSRLTSMETGLPVDRPLHTVLQERYAEITAMDRAIGTLRDYLAEEGLRENTIVWYCGDNGVPGPVVVTWPAGIPEPRISDVNVVTSDMLPTFCDLVGQPLPNRPLDGISLKPLFEGKMNKRPSPIFFWNYDWSQEAVRNPEPYIDPKLQEGTIPIAKLMDGLFTRNFKNYRHPEIVDEDYLGGRAVLDDRYKLVVDGHPNSGNELFDLRKDPAEKNNILHDEPEIAERLDRQLREWQDSVLTSLTGADYK
jgi:arylsulfatase A-like enzyme